MIPASNQKRCAAVPFEKGIHFRRKTDFLPEEDATKSFSGFEPEPTRLYHDLPRFHLNSEGGHPSDDQGPLPSLPLPSTSWEDLWLNSYLDYPRPHAEDLHTSMSSPEFALRPNVPPATLPDLCPLPGRIAGDSVSSNYFNITLKLLSNKDRDLRSLCKVLLTRTMDD
ncbi:hypothetical protein TNCV_4420261 [Trichonephila clavipes]|nr:hypothetical protein TNCV_4420261 [Trichonephila clavipes]